MRQDERRPFVEALQQAREAAYDPGEYVEQESFMRASEIRALADRARIVGGTSVLDVCCGVAGPGRFLTRELDCSYVGVDSSVSAVDIARERARGLPCRFVVAQVPPLPPGTFDAVLLLETMLAFRDKETLVEAISCALSPGGRFAFTIEEGMPLTGSERARMPDADTVWLAPLDEIYALLDRAGLAVRWQEDWSQPHRAMAESLTNAYAAGAPAIASQIGRRALDELLAAHRLWTEWLASGRVRKIAVVAERPAEGSAKTARVARPSLGVREQRGIVDADGRRPVAAHGSSSIPQRAAEVPIGPANATLSQSGMPVKPGRSRCCFETSRAR
jgi:SAM-dependent methyltransferase